MRQPYNLSRFPYLRICPFNLFTTSLAAFWLSKIDNHHTGRMFWTIRNLVDGSHLLAFDIQRLFQGPKLFVIGILK
jgi:hypothetical protein